MAFFAGASGERTTGSYSDGDGFSSDAGDWPEPEKESRDWKKIVLVIGLGALSWAATYIGMLELIQSNIGDLPLVNKLLIGFSVAMLMTMIIWLLDQIFSPSHFGAKIFFVLGYIFLTVISVGFGFGFYWKVLESRSESTRSAESAISQVQNSLHAGFTRMQQLNQTLVQLEQISTQKAVEEREKGTSCPNSSPGDGPRRKLRDADASSFRFSSQFVERRVGGVKKDMGALDGDLKKVVSGDKSTFDAKSGTRNDFLRDLNRRLELTVTGFNAFRTDPQLQQIRADLNDRAGKTVFPNGRGGTFVCPDPQLQAALRGVVRAIDQLPEMGKPQIAAVEGAEATIEAFRRLTASLIGILTLTPPPSPDDLRKLQKKAIQSVSGSGSPAAPAYAAPTGLGKRDYVPLAIAIFVDLCLLLVSIGRPMNRLNNLVPKMREAEKGPVIRILSRFNEIHRDPEIRQNFEVFRHVVFDYLGDYYVAVPLDTPYNRVSGANAYYGAADAQDLQHEAHLLANLFASFEQEKIFKRVYFMPTRTVRARLDRQGSKFAGSSAFRLYRFKEGAWSDIILGAIMGAAKRVEAEKRERHAIEEQQRADRGPELDIPNPTPHMEPKTDDIAARATINGAARATINGAARATINGSIGSSNNRTDPKRNGKAPPFVLRQTPDAPSGSDKDSNGHAVNGIGKLNGPSATAFANDAPNAIFIDDEDFGEDFEDVDLVELTAEDEAQVRSRYGKYADTVLAERTSAATRNASAQKTDEEEDQEDDIEVDTQFKRDTKPDFAATVANSNTMPAAMPKAAVNGNGAPNVIPMSVAQPVASVSPSATLHTPADTPQAPNTTVTLTRETATYTVPVSEAVLPAALHSAALASSQPVIMSQAVLKEEPQDFEQIDEEDLDAAPLSLTPPPLPGTDS